MLGKIGSFVGGLAALAIIACLVVVLFVFGVLLGAGAGWVATWLLNTLFGWGLSLKFGAQIGAIAGGAVGSSKANE